MSTCPSCGKELPPGDFPFCPFCTAPLETAPASREQRKTVTVLFCDVTGSTALGESTDPEALRVLLARYFERMKAILGSHGASVEKFIGDAVMAVFGVPQVHEDDALRACRAAVEMRDALPELGVQARIGVNTGEVVTGTEERLATGDAINVAARLEQAAQPGEVLLGEPTLHLVREAVEAEWLEPLVLKGKAEPVQAYRLLTVHEAPERRHEKQFVGRGSELDSLLIAWQRVLGERRCELVTVVGEAGVGKSRLTAEFLASVEPRAVAGRCLPYGEGITYWPVVEVVKQIDALLSDPAAAASLRSLLGETDAGTSAEEIAWAVRKLLEEQARERPLVVVFDDIQWGEETFLDLIEQVALLSSGAPILILCMARPELLDRRPSWPVMLRLEPLYEEEVERLIPGHMPGALRERIAHAAGGNPLFIVEMLAIAGSTDGELSVPPTLQALLAARLDQLEPSERRVLECAAVEGEIFHRGALQALAPQEQHMTARLAALVRREIVRLNRAQIPGDDGFRFRHLLLRDAAYEALAKATRAQLHARFAAWLEENGQQLVELDELLGHHLERAARYNRELGKPDAALAERAGARLAAAGQRTLLRGDWRAAISLLERALELLRPLRLDVTAELELAVAYHGAQRPEDAVATAEAAADRAKAEHNEAAEATARVVAARYRAEVAADPAFGEIETLARHALPVLEQADYHAGLVHVWLALAEVAGVRGQNEERARAIEHALTYARLAHLMPSHRFGLEGALVAGPRPVDEALRTIDALLPDSPHPTALLNRARLLAMLNRFDEAWAVAKTGSARLCELTGNDSAADLALSEIASVEGDHETVVRLVGPICDLYEERGYRAYLSTYAPLLGRSLCELGRHSEAEPLADLGRELGDEQDAMTQWLWRAVKARCLARRGGYNEAVRLARQAVAVADRGDTIGWQGLSRLDLAEVLAAAGLRDEAAEALEQALDLYERKKNLAMVAQVRPRLDKLCAVS